VKTPQQTQRDGSLVLTENSRFLPPLPKGRGTDRQAGGGILSVMNLTDRMVKEHKRTVPLCYGPLVLCDNRRKIYMNNWGIFGVIFAPLCVVGIFSLLKKTTSSKTSFSNNFVVKFPPLFLGVGIAGMLVSSLVMVLLTLFSVERPHLIFYIAFTAVLIASLYIVLKTVFFKVIVNDTTITVYNILRPTYSFEVDEIVSATRQLKGDTMNSERIIIKTTSGKKLIIQSSQMSYEKFSSKIKKEVKKERLSGFIII